MSGKVGGGIDEEKNAFVTLHERAEMQDDLALEKSRFIISILSTHLFLKAKALNFKNTEC